MDVLDHLLGWMLHVEFLLWSWLLSQHQSMNAFLNLLSSGFMCSTSIVVTSTILGAMFCAFDFRKWQFDFFWLNLRFMKLILQ